MTETKLRDAELPPTGDEIEWRHVWLTKASIGVATAKQSPALNRLQRCRRRDGLRNFAA
jgi:hypothetical protein